MYQSENAHYIVWLTTDMLLAASTSMSNEVALVGIAAMPIYYRINI